MVDVFRGMKQLKHFKKESTLLIIVNGMWTQHKRNLSSNTLKTYFANQLLTMTNGIWKWTQSFLLKLEQFWLFHIQEFLYLCFFVLFSHWCEVGGSQVEKGDVFPCTNPSIATSESKGSECCGVEKIICLCCQATVNLIKPHPHSPEEAD